MKILVVDDFSGTLAVFQILLKRLTRAEVLFARSGDEALDLLGDNQVDLVFIDLMLGGKLGFETAVKMKELNIAVPIVFLSTYSDKITKDRALSYGKDYIEKPFATEDIEKVLAKYGFIS
ncbi:MAG TPA: response regulator [Candidatus Nanoarchaeia archaeon]|nr:response regulator [Candidatus Nanoarchaeia archaeon]